MDRYPIFIIGLVLLVSQAWSQTFRHYDFVGAGHDHEIMVTTSSSKTMATGLQTVDGFSIKNLDQLKDASRFLAQATFGADFATIEMTAAMGYEAWLEEQFQLPQLSIHQEMLSHRGVLEEEEEEEEEEIPIVTASSIYFRSAWITHNLTTPDLLRQRMAFNFSQIMVINDVSDFFSDIGNIVGVYYDMLGSNTFENYEKLLTDVSFSPAMGNFLSHFNNPKADPANNINPDENYAREIMQLFSIGLWELNPDGTRKYDSNGQFIPTYNNADIKEFAQVFTGLGSGVIDGEFGVPADDGDIYGLVTNPMKMYEAYHDNSEKHLLNGVVLPANQSGIEDINQTIDHLSNHANTAPFICKALIKMMTTSNPSRAYVRDVASVFNPSAPNNFQEVIRAILLHPEARTCTPSATYTFGKLREPLVRLMNYLRAFPLANETGPDYYYLMECFAQNTGQSPMQAPSVFNFYLPDYQPPGPITQNYLVAPEFQILNSTNSIGLVNDVNNRTVRRAYFVDRCLEDAEDEEIDSNEDFESFFGQQMDYSEVLSLTDNPSALIDRLDILLANGLLTSDTKSIIQTAITQLEAPTDRIKMAIYLIMISPDYVILK